MFVITRGVFAIHSYQVVRIPCWDSFEPAFSPNLLTSLCNTQFPCPCASGTLAGWQLQIHHCSNGPKSLSTVWLYDTIDCLWQEVVHLRFTGFVTLTHYRNAVLNRYNWEQLESRWAPTGLTPATWDGRTPFAQWSMLKSDWKLWATKT